MNIRDEILTNPILQQVQAKFENQTVKGLAKYGETVNPNTYDTIGWLNHLQQELIDAVVYCEVLIQKTKDLEEENKRYREALEFYANGNHYSDKLYDDKIILLDDGEKARQALEGTE